MNIGRAAACVSVLCVPLVACGEGTQAPAQVSGCDASRFAAPAPAETLAVMFRDCGTRTLSEAEALVAEYGEERVFVRPASPDAMPLVLAELPATANVLVCNLSPNRGIVEVPEQEPTTQVITGRSCTPFEGVTKVSALGGRLSYDPKGNGEGGGAEEWFGVTFVAEATPPGP